MSYDEWIVENSTTDGKSRLEEKLSRAQSVWDVVGCCYSEVVAVGEKMCCKAFNDLTNNARETQSPEADALGEVAIGYRDWIHEHRIFEDDMICEEILRSIKTSSIPYLLHCCAVIKAVDEYADLDMGSGELIQYTVEKAVGPLGDVSMNPNVRIFACSQGRLLKDFHEKAWLRGNTVFYDSESINRKLKLKRLRLLQCNDYLRAVQENRYNDQRFFSGLLERSEPVVIGLSSVCGFHFLNTRTFDSSFRIEGFLAGTESVISERYIQTIEAMKAAGVHIALFPEMTLTDGILQRVQKHLEESNAHSLKLLILGSEWIKQTNRQYTITGRGELLAVNHKRHEFTYKPKLKQGGTEQKEYAEDLQDEPHTETVLVDTLGRILPLVCIDALNQDYNAMWQEVGVDMLMISAYTPSMSPFDKDLDNHVTKGRCILCMSNACIGGDDLTKGDAVGFVATPIKKGKENEKDAFPITKCGYCQENERESNACFSTFSLYPGKLERRGVDPAQREVRMRVDQRVYCPNR